jgi:hypothetical protein
MKKLGEIMVQLKCRAANENCTQEGGVQKNWVFKFKIDHDVSRPHINTSNDTDGKSGFGYDWRKWIGTFAKFLI